MSDTPKTTVRRLREEEVDGLIELWLAFSTEMAQLDPRNALAEGDPREAQRDYRRERLADDDARTFVVVAGGGTGGDGTRADGPTRGGDTAATGADAPAAADGGRLVGYATVERAAPPPVFARGDRLDLHELFVREPYRGTGVADRLVDRCLAWGRERGCERVRLSVNVDNDRARAFYERRGFEPFRLKLEREL